MNFDSNTDWSNIGDFYNFYNWLINIKLIAVVVLNLQETKCCIAGIILSNRSKRSTRHF